MFHVKPRYSACPPSSVDCRSPNPLPLLGSPPAANEWQPSGRAGLTASLRDRPLRRPPLPCTVRPSSSTGQEHRNPAVRCPPIGSARCGAGSAPGIGQGERAAAPVPSRCACSSTPTRWRHTRAASAIPHQVSRRESYPRRSRRRSSATPATRCGPRPPAALLMRGGAGRLDRTGRTGRVPPHPSTHATADRVDVADCPRWRSTSARPPRAAGRRHEAEATRFAMPLASATRHQATGSAHDRPARSHGCPARTLGHRQAYAMADARTRPFPDRSRSRRRGRGHRSLARTDPSPRRCAITGLVRLTAVRSRVRPLGASLTVPSRGRSLGSLVRRSVARPLGCTGRPGRLLPSPFPPPVPRFASPLPSRRAAPWCRSGYRAWSAAASRASCGLCGSRGAPPLSTAAIAAAPRSCWPLPGSRHPMSRIHTFMCASATPAVFLAPSPGSMRGTGGACGPHACSSCAARRHGMSGCKRVAAPGGGGSAADSLRALLVVFPDGGAGARSRLPRHVSGRTLGRGGRSRAAVVGRSRAGATLFHVKRGPAQPLVWPHPCAPALGEAQAHASGSSARRLRSVQRTSRSETGGAAGVGPDTTLAHDTHREAGDGVRVP